MKKSKTLNKQFDMTAHHNGLKLEISTTDDETHYWLHDAWNVTINGQSFPYKTGVGHRVLLERERAYNYKQAMRIMSKHPEQSEDNLRRYMSEIEKVSKPTKPKIDDVLYGLIMDSEADGISFEEWCSIFEYDTDSRRALETYLTCQDTAQKVRKLGINLESARDAFSDY